MFRIADRAHRLLSFINLIEAHVLRVIADTRITTAEIAARVIAGETVDQVAEDLDLTSQQIEDAILFERRAVGSC